MGEKRSYGQYCTVARALDVVGERWTLLLVRELSTGPKRFKDLLEGLPGIGTNTEFSEVQLRCVGMGGASASRFLRSTRSLSHPTSTRSAALTKRMSSGLRSSMCLW